MLAHSDRADLRRQALQAIEAHPSPAHKALLGALLQDSASEVRTLARAVKTHLEDLANFSPQGLRVD